MTVIPSPRGTGLTVAFVAGVGRFGSRALEELRRRHPRWKLAAADVESERIAAWARQGVEAYPGDAVEALDRLLDVDSPRWIVPAVPFHLAFEWVLRRLACSANAIRRPLPPQVAVPNAMLGSRGDLYASFATFRCPEHCPEPKGRCTFTGEKRPVPLYRLLGRLAVPDHRVVGVRSYQLAPGAGGVRSEDMLDLLAAVQETPGDWILYTSCRCHGVLSGLRW